MITNKKIVLASILSLLFTIFAILQLNDPDPEIWGTIYFAVAILCLVSPWGKYSGKVWRLVYYGAIVALSIGILLYVPDLINWVKLGTPTIVGKMKADEPHIEYVRELGGLMICLVALIYCRKTMKLN